MIITRITWVLFAVVLAFVAYISLKACELNLPVLGGLISHCPSQPLVKPYVDELADTRRLTKALQNLRIELSGIKECEVEDAPIPPPIVTDVEVKKAAEVLIILDDSISMLEASDANKHSTWQDLFNRRADLLGLYDAKKFTREHEKEFQEINKTLQVYGDQNKSRLQTAKNAIIPVLSSEHESPISLWSFNNCELQPKKHFPVGDVSAKDSVVQLEAIGNTPIAETIDFIPKMISLGGAGKSADKSINVVLFTDGQDNCLKEEDKLLGASVCSSARQLKKAYPYIYIHSVSLVDNLDAVRCVADETGGIAGVAGDQESLSKMLEYIAEESK